MARKSNIEEFIKKAKKVHGDRYSYELSKYVNSTTDLTITCEIHGEFKLKPSKHLSGRGCQECGYEIMRNHKRDSIEDFVGKAKKAHGDKYDYSKVEYVNTYVNVTIVCPVHGEFHQMPNHHVKGSGCWKCTGKSPLNTNTFIKRAKDVHGERYDYSATNYVNTHSDVKIICKEHGAFEQRANDHLNGSGCPECGVESRANLARNTTENFIEKAKEVHGNKYDYSRVNYIRINKNVDIVCPEHGVFSQRPLSHFYGSGCPECIVREGHYNITKAERHKDEWQSVEEYVYIIEFESKEENYIKIGVARNVKHRLSKLKKVTGCKVINKHLIKTNLYAAVMAEQTFLESNKHLSYTPLAKFPGHTECIITEEKSNTINQIQTLIKNYEPN